MTTNQPITRVQCEAEVRKDQLCRIGATVIVRGNDYVVGGVHQGRRVRVCQTHRYSAEMGQGIWVYLGDSTHEWYPRGALKYEGESAK